MTDSTERVVAEILSVHDGVRARGLIRQERIVRHTGTAIMCRNAGEKVVSYEEIAKAMVTVTANFQPLIEAFKSVKAAFEKTGATLARAFQEVNS